MSGNMEEVIRKSSKMVDMKSESLPDVSAPSMNKCEHDDDMELQMSNCKKKSFFQITSVTENVNDENDSMDELDESKADDVSSADLSKVSAQTDVEHSDVEGDLANSASVGALNPTISAISLNAELNGNSRSRFKLVKVARIEPIKRGRWVCKDFSNEPQPITTGESSASKQEQLRENVSGSSSAASSVHYVPGENPPTENPLTDGVSLTQSIINIDKSTKDSMGTNISTEVTSTGDNNRDRSKSEPQKDQNRRETSNLPSLKDSLNIDANADNESEKDDSTSATGGAIDNKIEQAMDLVKSHLLFAVREEVELLKEQINELLEKNEKLQRENKALRQQNQLTQHRSDPFLNQPPQTKGSEQFSGLQAGPSHGQQAAPSQQTLPQQQATQYGTHIQSVPPPQLSIPQTPQHHQQPQNT